MPDLRSFLGGDSISAAFRWTVARFPDNDLVHVPSAACASYSDEPLTITYAEAARAVDALVERYAAAGVGARHRVVLMLENRIEFFVHFLALNALGASLVPVNSEAASEEIAYFAQHSGAALAIVLPEHLDRVRASLTYLDAPQVGVATRCWTEFQSPASLARADAGSGEAALLYTSGTTGLPKGCILSQEYFLHCGRWYNAMGEIAAVREGRERLITPLPLNHSNALAWSFMAMLLSGGCVVQLDRFRPSTWWPSVRESRATIIHYLGVMPAMLLKQAPDAVDPIGAQVRFGFGAGVDPRHHLSFEERFGFPLIEAWAMTETGAGGIIAADHEPRHVGTRCFGVPGGSVRALVIDDDGRPVGDGVAGELLVRQAGLRPDVGFFSGYHGDPAATAAAWIDGWFRTGDVVVRNPDGSMRFVDRARNIVRRSGENIAAVEVEGVLLRHPAVRSCAVMPVPDEIRGEEVGVAIVLSPESVGDEEMAIELFELVNDNLSYFKAPGHLAFVAELPMTGSQKIRRGELRALMTREQEGRRTFDLTARKRRLRGQGSVDRAPA
ncbi:AMP-binding protein [Rhizorhabdus wittichii]|uniref:AMP-binding protein n=1 Tax=Rhizorhabdus wittichii TaxID=160791 RepID=A0A975D6M9_9SPHN|nr:AMP-binding protein [Rhizorhabdus wittichii]QTH23992.1 AMP-binding protein [Rhizorhabdus wittichii]